MLVLRGLLEESCDPIVSVIGGVHTFQIFPHFRSEVIFRDEEVHFFSSYDEVSQENGVIRDVFTTKIEQPRYFRRIVGDIVLCVLSRDEGSQAGNLSFDAFACPFFGLNVDGMSRKCWTIFPYFIEQINVDQEICEIVDQVDLGFIRYAHEIKANLWRALYVFER